MVLFLLLIGWKQKEVGGSWANVQYQPLLFTFNDKTKIKKYDQNNFSDMTKQTILSSHRA